MATFPRGDWVSLLAFRPEFEECCDKHEGWAKLDVRQWVFLLKSQPLFSEKCNSVGKWREFDGFDWVELLRAQPSFAAKCEEVDGWGRIAECGRWCELLELCPQFANKCDEYKGWKRFDGFDWWRLLRSQRCFIEKSNVWNGWKKIYIYEPYHVCESDHCGGIITAWDNFDNTYPAEYSETFERNGRWGSPYWNGLFALFDAIGIEFDENETIFVTDESSLWRVDNSYWIYVVMQFPCSSWRFERELQFIDIFNRRGICRRFSSKDWQLAIGKGDCTFLSEVAPLVDGVFWEMLQHSWPTWFEGAEGARKQETDTAEQNIGFSAWPHLLCYKPEYAFACKAKRGWDGFEADDWGHLLGEGSCFLEKVDSKMLDGGFWFPLLTQAPHFCQICDKYNGWITLTGDRWCLLLLKHPKLADRCHVWAQFGGRQWVELLKRTPALFGVCGQSDGWAKLTKEDWLGLLLERASFAVACEKSGAMAKFGWKTKSDAIEEAMEKHNIVYDDGPPDVLEVPGWREESGWNDMYGDADPADFIDYR